MESDYQITCPDCGETWRFWSTKERLAREIDAAMHWVEKHEGPIPDHALFGEHQCPKCLDILGFNGTVSCSECGYIPDKVRLKP